jgi:peptide deformylase
MPMLQIVEYPHPALRYLSKPLRRVDATLRALVARMFELMYEANGVGLAANQVNLPYRLFVMNPTGDPSGKDEELAVINPVLSRRRGRSEADEGCLSLPGLYAPVARSEHIALSGFTLTGEPLRLELSGMKARIVQHETDHLDGVLFIDKVSPEVRDDLADELAGFERTFRSRQQQGEIPPDAAIVEQLRALEAERC